VGGAFFVVFTIQKTLVLGQIAVAAVFIFFTQQQKSFGLQMNKAR
jgi:hypothetical protein